MRFAVAMLMLLIAVPVFGQTSTCTVQLFWDANTETNLSGYQVLYGTAPGTYNRNQTVPKDPLVTTVVPPARTTAVTFTGSECASRWYFVVKAFDTAGMYSGPSNEINIVPVPATRKPRPTVRVRPTPAN